MRDDHPFYNHRNLSEKELLILDRVKENINSARHALDRLDLEITTYAGPNKERWAKMGDFAAKVNRMKNSLGCSNYSKDVINFRFAKLAQERSECDLKTVDGLTDALKRQIAASRIQSVWRDCISNPSRAICRRRLLREFEQMDV